MKPALLVMFLVLATTSSAMANPVTGTLKGELFGQDQIVSTLATAPASSTDGVYSGLASVRTKAEVSKEGIRLTCTSPKKLAMAYYLELLSNKKLYVADANGHQLIANKKRAGFQTKKIRLGNTRQQLTLKALNGVSVKATLKVEQPIVKGATCLYTITGTLYR